MRRSLTALAALTSLAATACSRDVAVPPLLETPPRIDAVAVVGLEPQAVTSGLRVLGGELVAIRGGGFGDGSELEVTIDGVDAEVLDAAQDRVVVRVPSLAAFGALDVQVRTPVGFRTQQDALRYEGSGQPLGFGVSDLPTNVAIGFVAPVQPPGSFGFSDLAIATGASDSALLVLPAAGIAVTSIPLGLVPVSAAARFVDDGGNARIQVLAFGRGGEAALGTALLDAGASAVERGKAIPLANTTVRPQACTTPQLLFTYDGPGGDPLPVATWFEDQTLGRGQTRIATLDAEALTTIGGELRPKDGIVWDVGGVVVGWAPWGAASVVFATSRCPGAVACLDPGVPQIWVYDAGAQTAPTPLTFVPAGSPGPPVPVSSRLPVPLQCDGAPDFIYTLSAATSGTSSAVAVAYRAGNTDRVALVDVTAGTVDRGFAGTIPTSLALVPDPPFAATTEWSVLAAGITNLYRFRPLENGPACQDLVSDAALPLSTVPGTLPTFGGMAAVSHGTRLLATTPDRDLVTVFPPTLTSAGPITRFASYGGVSVQQAVLGGSTLPIAVAEHAASGGFLAGLDTGSALLVLSLAGDGGAVALGGAGYARGAVWLDQPGDGSSLAYTGDLASTNALAFVRGGAAAVTGFAPGQCEGEDVRIESSRPVLGGPDLMVQGPARAGALGPSGVERHGPAGSPVYGVKGTDLTVYVPGPGNLLCLGGASPNWSPDQCAPAATVTLGVEPLDVTVSAGDRSVALRYLDPGCVDAVSTDPDPRVRVCRPDLTKPVDLVCVRSTCGPASQLRIVDAATSVPSTIPLPTPPVAVAADRGGGFVVTLACESGGAGGECFGTDALCDAFETSGEGADGALVFVPEDGSAPECLAVLHAIAGPVAVTPNGREAWVTSTTQGRQILSRLVLSRSPADGTIDLSLPVERAAFEDLGSAFDGTGSSPPGGIAFTPDGSTAIVTVPGDFRILLYE
jgi:hypothetical protein